MRKYFITGSLIVLPALITIFLFLWLFRFLDGILGRYINYYLMSQYGYTIPGLGIIFAIIFILFVGFVATHLINRSVLLILEGWFVRFPLIKQIYPAVKQMVYFLFANTKTSFKRTVLVEFPRKGIYSLGFMTNDGCKYFNEKTDKELVTVLIPTTPSPLTGYLIFVPKEDIVFVDISVEDALKIIISGGVVNPLSKN
ncbi:MAG: DUF502 domain-containing protein [Candidatus Omnitrophica bacterium]|nr:DUF502 domain-containing protein [Candidatus Omnitrophota bacterium]MDD5351771.1 DUF502 domain-containing protein [Candidatus Omnitrophota bacterium]MDD5550597.1 DUF502 domain-containing protein [Candidatus Omnitrophota bacterium]